MAGYLNKIVKVNLSTGNVQIKELSESIARKYIGGTGLAAYLLSGTPFGLIDSLGPENVLVFLAGPLTGTTVPASGRYAVAAKSPLTGIWGESDSGGRFGVALKSAGYDAIVIEGKANNQVYLLVNDQSIDIVPAAKLWGKDTFETHDILQNKYGKKAAIVCIGPAGENLVPYACILTEGKHARAAGRCGLGAVMGSKNLKAVVAFGSRRAIVANAKELRESIRESIPLIRTKTKRLRDYGTAGAVVGNAVIGDMSAYNWTDGNCAELAEKISGESMAREYFTGRYHCPGCIVGCGKTVRVPRGPYRGSESGGPEYETIAGLGAQLGIWDLALIIELNDLCNRLGMDTISASSTIAFLFEAAARGFEVPSLTPGEKWGNGPEVIKIIHQIVANEGVGSLARLGVREAARVLGPEAEKFAMHVKGLEFPYHDPRALKSLAVAYATSPRGACHRGCTHNLERYPIPGLGYPEALDRFDNDGKGKAAALVQNYAELFNCLKLCQLYMSAVDVPVILKWTNAVTGWNMDQEEFLKAGERSINLKRVLNFNCGVTVKDDTLPFRALREPFLEGGAAGQLPDLNKMLDEYYQTRGWDKHGIPTHEKLKELDIVEIVSSQQRSVKLPGPGKRL